MTEYAYERRVGTKRIGGTDHPVRVVVYKGKRREWVLAVICLGTASMTLNFATRKAAVASAQEWVR